MAVAGFNPNREAITSGDWEQRLSHVKKNPLTLEQKQSKLDAIMAPDKQAGFQRVGQGMIGPIQIRLRYEGIVRNVLMEDPLERGPLMPYDVLDDLGMAYTLNSTDGEVKIQNFEGKQVYPNLFRIASFPRLRKEDLYYLRVNIVEYAQDESRQAIQKAEDIRLILLLEGAIVAYGQAGLSPVGGTQVGISLGPTGLSPDRSLEKTVLVGSNSPLEPADFYSAVSMVEIEQLEARKLLSHPQDLRDLYTWDINVTGWAFKDKVVGGEKITNFGEFEIQRSVMVPQGEVFLLPESNFLGVMPIMYSLDVEENHKVEQFYKGWVMDELISMLILNQRGLARIVKADTWAASNVITDISTRGLYS